MCYLEKESPSVEPNNELLSTTLVVEGDGFKVVKADKISNREKLYNIFSLHEELLEAISLERYGIRLGVNDFDFDQLDISSTEWSANKAFSFRCKNDLSDMNLQLILTIFVDDSGDLFNASLVEVIDRRQLSLLSLASGDESNFIFSNDKVAGKFSSIIAKDSKARISGCGQETMNCISDVYSNHGWWSVAVSVETAFFPQTMVAFAAVCAAKNC
ncbi:hypothetical protein CLV98_106166 [Dyadobacter jejuensis]|uniref:Uncharacterized protein n=1 Tax=Dyadobacter jejuensis TaxID=1082580 RepID=A0A316AKY0_9BACT|nr:hypothetical protein [Dyadobacter jejuensis]PWJ57694.1 hypothetical protein CLV98_106166 [Dyadobacter jejuensis]